MSVCVQVPDAFGWLIVDASSLHPATRELVAQTVTPASRSRSLFSSLLLFPRPTPKYIPSSASLPSSHHTSCCPEPELHEPQTASFNATRVRTEEHTALATQQVVAWAASLRDPVTRLHTATPEVLENRELLSPAGAFAQGAMAQRVLRAYDDLGYRMRHSTLKCLASMLTFILALDSACLWIMSFVKTAREGGKGKRVRLWASRVVTSSGTVLSAASGCGASSMGDVFSGGSSGSAHLRSGAASAAGHLTSLGDPAACQALGPPSTTCGPSTALWLLTEGGRGGGDDAASKWGGRGSDRDGGDHRRASLLFYPEYHPTDGSSRLSPVTATSLSLHYRLDSLPPPLVILRLQPPPRRAGRESHEIRSQSTNDASAYRRGDLTLVLALDRLHQQGGVGGAASRTSASQLTDEVRMEPVSDSRLPPNSYVSLPVREVRRSPTKMRGSVHMASWRQRGAQPTCESTRVLKVSLSSNEYVGGRGSVAPLTLLCLPFSALHCSHTLCC